jgi:predicted hotdog family 3-hydroxylacyl-ACP dehydratase
VGYIRKMKLPTEDILSLIPQKQPFVMVDQLLYTDDKITRSSFTIGADNIFTRDNVFQEAGLLENIAQTAALRAGYTAQAENKKVAPGYIGSVKNLEIFILPKVKQSIVTEVMIETKVMGITVLIGKVWHGQDLLAQSEMRVFTDNE